MQLQIDQNNILSIHHADISANKEYQNVVGGFSFSSVDKGILVYHKKDIKVISLKNLGENMSVFYISPRPEIIEKKLNKESFLQALSLFKGFDEETGSQYYFFPRFSINEIEKTNGILSKLLFDIHLDKSNKGVIIPYFIQEAEDISSDFSFLFALTLLYGKLDIKNGNLTSAKIHIPLYGSYLSKKEDFQNLVKSLQSNGIFINISSSTNEEGEILQISITDYEILASFANFYQTIEKIKEIPKQESASKIKIQLIDYIQNKLESDIGNPIENKNPVLDYIKSGTLKILTK